MTASLPKRRVKFRPFGCAAVWHVPLTSGGGPGARGRERAAGHAEQYVLCPELHNVGCHECLRDDAAGELLPA